MNVPFYDREIIGLAIFGNNISIVVLCYCTLELRAKQAIKEKMSCMEFLEVLFNDENLNHIRNKRKELMKRSRMPQHKTIGDVCVPIFTMKQSVYLLQYKLAQRCLLQ